MLYLYHPKRCSSVWSISALARQFADVIWNDNVGHNQVHTLNQNNNKNNCTQSFIHPSHNGNSFSSPNGNAQWSVTTAQSTLALIVVKRLHIRCLSSGLRLNMTHSDVSETKSHPHGCMMSASGFVQKWAVLLFFLPFVSVLRRLCLEERVCTPEPERISRIVWWPFSRLLSAMLKCTLLFYKQNKTRPMSYKWMHSLLPVCGY